MISFSSLPAVCVRFRLAKHILLHCSSCSNQRVRATTTTTTTTWDNVITESFGPCFPLCVAYVVEWFPLQCVCHCGVRTNMDVTIFFTTKDDLDDESDVLQEKLCWC